MATNYEKWESTMMELHNYKPHSFNPDYDLQAEKDYEEYNKKFQEYTKNLEENLEENIKDKIKKEENIIKYKIKQEPKEKTKKIIYEKYKLTINLLKDKLKEALSEDDFDYKYNTYNRQAYLDYIEKRKYGEKYKENFLEKRGKRTFEKYNIKENDIIFQKSSLQNNINRKDIILKDKAIGILEERKDKVQYVTFINKKYLKLVNVFKTLETEDKDEYYLIFDNLDDLIEYNYFIEQKEKNNKKNKKRATPIN